LISDYRVYGFGQLVTRYIALFGSNPDWLIYLMPIFSAFVNLHGLTPEEMVAPVYGAF